MILSIRRREFITLLGGAAAWPFAARGQPSAMPVIGFLWSGGRDFGAHRVTAFRDGLDEAGYFEGRNVTFEHRWAEGHYDRLPELAADLIRRQVAVIVAEGTPAAFAVKTATTAIPIVVVMGGDPVQMGLIASLNRPGGNVTGVNVLVSALLAKQLEILREMVPGAGLIGFLVNPTGPNGESETRDVQAAAEVLGQKLLVVRASTDGELEWAFAALARQRVSALVIGADVFFNNRLAQLVAMANRQALPSIYVFRDFPAMGGLMSYGTSLTDGFRRIGSYSGRILKGERPAELPMQQSTKVELVINLKTAKTLGISIPLPLFGRADEVIE
jgi:putative ABC transport system substrate-binding protein